MTTTGSHSLQSFCDSLAAKQATPGGGAAAAVGAAVGAAAAHMAAAYTQRKVDEESGNAEKARHLMELLRTDQFL
jgi:formiminotetrahydrofolate cyclodeaminase